MAVDLVSEVPIREVIVLRMVGGLVVCFFGWLLTTESRAELAVEKVADSVVDQRALTIQGPFGQAINGKSFQQDALVTHGDYQYLGYYDAGRQVCLTRRKLPAGDWEVIRFTDYQFTSDDAHNTISLGICVQDGTIHLAFDHHGGPLNYRVSRTGVATDPEDVEWSAELFGPVISELEPNRPIRLTYPRFWQTPEGGLQFGYRIGGSGNGHRMLVDYDGETGAWANTRQVDSGDGSFSDSRGESNSRCSYPNGYTYGPDGKLHVTWVWRESAHAANHNLMYAYSDDRGATWKNNDGEVFEGPPHVDSPGVTVVAIPRGYGLMNTGGQTIDSQGRVHAVVWHCTDETLEAAGAKPGEMRWGPHTARRNHHYWRDEAGQWHHNQLPGLSGSRPKIFVDDDDNAYVIFGKRPDSWTGHNAFPENYLTIMAASADSRWTDWREIHKEPGAVVSEMLFDNVRLQRDGILSVMVQDTPHAAREPTPLRVLDFRRLMR